MSLGLGGTGMDPRTGLAIGPQRDDVTDLAALDSIKELLAGLAVPAHEADADLEILLDGFLCQGQHLPRGRAIDGDRLLHEDVQSLLDGVGEMDPAKSRGRGEDDRVAWLQAVHGLAIGVETEEFLVLVNGQLFATAVLLVELVVARFELVTENVGHRDELDRAALGRKGIGRGSGATTPAANQGHLDQVALARMDERDSRLRDGRGGRNQAGGLQKFTTRGR